MICALMYLLNVNINYAFRVSASDAHMICTIVFKNDFVKHRSLLSCINVSMALPQNMYPYLPRELS